MSFHELLSDLNPLQYIPVIGTIYRSVTGDTIPESVRTVGSFAFSGLTGGPVGLATNAAMLVLEKLTGIDPEKIGHDVLASIGIGKSEDSAPAAPAAATPSATASAAAPAGAAASPQAVTPAHGWSPSQLSAYGVVTTAQGTLKHGDLVGSDVLNDLELARARDTGPPTVALATAQPASSAPASNPG